MACLNGDDHDNSVMSYDAFIYVLLRTAADYDASFRTAFHQDPEATLASANHGFNRSNLGGDTLTLPTREEAQNLLNDYLPDYEGTKMAKMKVRFNWTLPESAS